MKKSLSRDQVAELAAVAALPDEAIDKTDIPEASPESWLQARRGPLFRPVKQPVTIRLDADVLLWFKQHADGGKYQTEINQVLRRHVDAMEKSAANRR